MDSKLNKTINAIIKKPTTKLISIKINNKVQKSNEYIETLERYKPKGKKITSTFCGDSVIRVESDKYMSRYFVLSNNDEDKWVLTTRRKFKKIDYRMKFPDHLNKDEYYKTCDTNIDIHSDNNYFGAFLKKWFNTNNIWELYNKNITVHSIHARDMINTMRTFEVSMFHDPKHKWSNTNCVGKLFTDGEKTELINLEKIEELLKGVNTRLYSKKGYMYIEFFDACGKVLYIISQRSKEDGYKGNCAFINRCLLDYY